MGWKDILRPIRDRLRDNLPHTGGGEDADDKRRRLSRRDEDVVKGYFYLDDADELDSWHPDHIQPHQKANTPLLQRPRCCNNIDGSKSGVTLIHDYSGNYHDYEDVQPTAVENKLFACHYLQHVDRFVYFSHKLLCVPPPSWTNALHRNGVVSLGTFLVEPQSDGIEKIFQRATDDSGNSTYRLADRLIQIAKTCQFDGYLINLEKTFPIFKWNLLHLVGFLTQLRLALGEGNVIWYDALNTENNVEYQNGVTNLNVSLAQAAGAIVTNYEWTPELARSSLNLAMAYGIKPRNVIFGIDVWAQNAGYEGPQRRTWPCPGGGGTGTGRAVAELADIGLSSGLFAPAWSYEHFSAYQENVEKSMWTGQALLDDVDCSCKPTDVHRVPFYRDYPILQSAQEAPVGSLSFFHADFEPALRTDEDTKIAQIGSQSVLPRQSTEESLQPIQFEVRGGGLLVKFDASSHFAKPGPSSCYRQLFQLHMHSATALEAVIRFRKPETFRDAEIKIVFHGTDAVWQVPRLAVEDGSLKLQVLAARTLGLDVKDRILSGVGIVVSCSDKADWLSTGPHDLLALHSICIKQVEEGRLLPRAKIHNVRRERLQGPRCLGSRLSWSLDFESWRGDGGADIPYSAVTGPFAHFLVESDGLFTWRVHARQVNLSKEIETKLDGLSDAAVDISGFGFDGSLLCRSRAVWRELTDVGSDEDMADKQQGLT